VKINTKVLARIFLSGRVLCAGYKIVQSYVI